MSREIRLTCFIINGNKKLKYAKWCDGERIKKLNYGNEFISDLSWSQGGKFILPLFIVESWNNSSALHEPRHTHRDYFR